MFWNQAKVFVTGADGFIGSHLVEMLVKQGASVRALVQYNPFNSWGWLENVPAEIIRHVDVQWGDIRDPAQMRTLVRGADIVFHLAALVGIPYSYLAPDCYIETNVKGTLNLLQACRYNDVRRVVVTSTSEVYGTAQTVPINEQHPLQPQSPYSASKIAADALAESFRRAFNLPVIIARPFNTFGPRQSARAVIPTIITQALAGSHEVHLGALHPTRDFLYVEDTCCGLLALASCDAAVGKTVNIGTGTEISIGQLAAKILSLMKSDATVVYDKQRVRPALSEVERLVCDASLMRSLTGWFPKVSLDEGLLRTIEWFRCEANRTRYKPDIYNV